MKYLAPQFILLFISSTLYAQVGIGTTAPSAQLEIAANGSLPNLPLLELQPQASPTGTETGQLAVIGDQLFMFDNTRNKWLSIETVALQYNKGGDLDNAPLRFGGDLRVNTSGPKMPFDGTIVYVTGMSDAGQTDKTFEIQVRNGTTTVATETVTYSALQLSRTDLNLDFSAGDYLTVFINNAGGTVQDTAFVLWVKWRE